MEKKKGTIIIFSTAYLPFIGGAENAIKGITDNVDDFHFILLTARLKKGLSGAEKIGNTLVYRLGFGIFFDKYFLPFSSFFKFISIKKNLEKPFLFWGVMVSYGSIGVWFLKFFFPKVPFILTIQEGNMEWKRRRFWWWLILKRANYVTAISSFLLERVKNAGYSGKAAVIPNGVGLDKFTNQESGIRKHVIISTSRRVHKNGIDILEKAFAIVKNKFPNAELKIISDIKHEDLPKYLHAADVFVRPSRSEGLGVSFLEAMAAGLPIIGTPVGGIPDFLKDGETGLFTKVDDPEDLAKKIELLFSDEALRQKLVRNGRKLVEEKYQWSKIARDMGKIFKELCAS